MRSWKPASFHVDGDIGRKRDCGGEILEPREAAGLLRGVIGIGDSGAQHRLQARIDGMQPLPVAALGRFQPFREQRLGRRHDEALVLQRLHRRHRQRFRRAGAGNIRLPEQLQPEILLANRRRRIPGLFLLGEQNRLGIAQEIAGIFPGFHHSVLFGKRDRSEGGLRIGNSSDLSTAKGKRRPHEKLCRAALFDRARAGAGG